MCGLLGVMSVGRPVVSTDSFQRCLRMLAHRGPDGEGIFQDKIISLGHRRLSIIDLEAGRQPLSNEDGTVWITFNGEIYNYRDLRQRLIGLGHRFQTDSDTETIVHAWEQWGPECVHQLRGMFAFAIWDQNQQSLFLARDRVGIKPLLYTVQPGFVAFASEMQALTCLPDLPLTVNAQAIDLYLHYQYIPAPYSIYTEIKKIEPGHSLLIRHGQPVPEPRQYWTLKFQPDRGLDERQWLDRLDAALEETVRTHLVADVPFGAFLSGGLDSSTVVAYMSRILKQPVKSFCIGHGDVNYDERNWAHEAARITGAEYHEEVVEPEGLTLLPDLVKHYGEPFADSSAIPTWYVSRLARKHVKMVLSGDGGDELFAGYYAYPAILAQHRRPLEWGLRIRHAVGNQARRVGLRPPLPSMADNKFARTAVLSETERTGLWKADYQAVIGRTRQQFEVQFTRSFSSEPLNQLQGFDVGNYIPYDNLTKVDVASMSHGLEVRVPLLDHQFMETVAQIPPEMKLRPEPGNGNGKLETLQSPVACVGKYLLKRNAERFFPKEFIHRGKRGFEVPVCQWFAGPHKAELADRLTGANSHIGDYFESHAVQQLVQQAGHDKVSAWKAWSLLVLEEFLQQARATSLDIVRERV